MQVWSRIEQIFIIDKRALKLFRILLGLVLLHDTLVRLSDAQAFYSDQGVLPLFAAKSLLSSPWEWSVLAFGDSPLLRSIVFGCLIASAVALMLGRFTKLALCMAWLGLVSLQNRNPIIYQGGDDLLRMLVFWSFFLPWKRIDRAFAPVQVLSFATAFLLLQVLFPFFFSALFKGWFEWWYQGSALYYALSLDQLTRPLGHALAPHYQLTVFLTRLAFIGELLVLPLFLIPFARTTVSWLVFGFVFLFFLATSTLMLIGLFPLCFLACSVLFLPSSFWQKVWPFEGDKASFQAFESDSPSLKQIGTDFFLLFSFVLVCIWNLQAIPSRLLVLPKALLPVMHMFKLTQSWGMFAPTVLKEDGWLVLEAQLENGQQIDLNAPDRILSYQKPASVLERIKNDRWRKYSEQIVNPANKRFLPDFANFLLLDYYHEKPSKQFHIKHLKVVHVLELSKPFPNVSTLEKRVLYETASPNLKLLP
jgi:hypothetical protein